MDEKTIREHIRNFAICGAISFVMTAGFSIFKLFGFSYYNLIDAGLVAVLTAFTYAMRSRIASTAMLAYWIFNMYAFFSGGTTSVIGILMQVLLLFYFFMGTVATYQYHKKLEEERKEKKPSLMTRRVLADLVEVVLLPLAAGALAGSLRSATGFYMLSMTEQLRVILIILVWLSVVMYLFFKDSFFQGQSLMKMALGLRVVDKDTRVKCRWWQSLVRNALFLVSFFALLELIVVFSNSERRRIGDYLARTIVVDADEEFLPKPASERPVQENLLKAVTVLLAAALVLSITFTIYFSSGQKNTLERIKQSYDPVVVIYTYDRHNKIIGFGSGFFINSDGVLVTNRHVILNAFRAVVIFKQKDIIPIDEVLDYDEATDLAVLRAHIKKTPFLRLGDSDKINVGEDVYTIGAPIGLESTVSKGIISQLRSVYGIKLIQTDAPISPGSSGGPLLNSDLSVIGINVAYIKGAQELNFAVPVNYVKQMLARSKIKME